jgi:ubiquinone/menaquinone biosynthesis C-methylase UbiE
MKQRSIVHSWSSDNVVKYYVSHRDSSETLYRSEKVFLQEALLNAAAVLDIGCAAGSFSRIVHEFNKTIQYTGVDIAPRMIAEAKKRFPDDRFFLIDGHKLPFADKVFDAVICFGVLHMTENWKTLLAEAWRVCRGSLLLDLRITDSVGVCDMESSYQKLEFEGVWDGVSKAPYIVVNINDFMKQLVSLQPEVSALKAFGYIHPVSEMTVSRFQEVCMAAFHMKKSENRGLQITSWNMPIVPDLSKFRDIVQIGIEDRP